VEVSDSRTEYVFEGPLYFYESKVEDIDSSTGSLKLDGSKVDSVVYICSAPSFTAEYSGSSNSSAYSILLLRFARVAFIVLRVQIRGRRLLSFAKSDQPIGIYYSF
jgi:hypothetical protein